MTDSTKVRLVRCPKCENLLPELANYSVYQCGGCGAVLRAKNKNQDRDTLPQKSEEPQIAEATAESPSSLEKGVVELSDTSDVDVKSNTGSLSGDGKNPEKTDLGDGNTCSMNQAKAKTKTGKWIVENDVDVDMNRDDSGDSAGRENGDLNSEIRHTSRSWRSGQMSGWQRGDKADVEGLPRVMKTEVEGVRFPASNYPDEGPSNYNSDFSYSFGETLINHDKHNGPNRVQHLEKDRAELCRKLDELKEQLSKSCDIADKPKEKAPLNGRMAPLDPYAGSGAWFPGTSSMPDQASMQFFVPDKHAAGPPYLHHHPDPYPCTNGHRMAFHNLHPSMHMSNRVPGYGDPFGPKRGLHHLSGQYQQPSRQYFSRHYFDAKADPYDPYAPNATFHHPSCSCFHCYERHFGVPATSLSNKRYPDVSSNPMLYQHENSAAFGPYVHNSRVTVPPLDVRGPQSHARWPSDLNSHARPQRVVLASGGRCYRPIVGGAPFYICFNCFELLHVPKEALLKGKNQQKIQCGACSAVISFAIVNKKLVLSVNMDVPQIPADIDDRSTEIINESTSYSHACMIRMNPNFSSDDYDNSGYDFHTIDTDPISLLPGQGLKHQEMNSFHGSSPSTSDNENSPEALVPLRNVNNSVLQPIKASLLTPPGGSPLQQHFDFSSNNHNNAVNQFGKGNPSSHSDQEKVITNKATTRQNTMDEASLATEIEVPCHEYSNTGVSQDSGDANREDSQLKVNKGGDSFFANIVKKSFKDFSRSNQTDVRDRSNISINGHFIPDRVVKRAEKIAGLIHPGQYWYDSRAGFWGVIGGPCLGIIPPFIEEFNYPMPENCAGGTTGVFVNGRELHQKDLDLLAGRGLPTNRDRSYIIEISGRVLDEDTGKELDSLGKLAPTVEKLKHGFGMKVRKAAA